MAMTIEDQALAKEDLGLNVGRFLKMFYNNGGMIRGKDLE